MDKLFECKSCSNYDYYFNWMKIMLKKYGLLGFWLCGWILEIVY